MQYIITALKSEAKPIIDYYGLKFSGLSNFPLYKNDNFTLLITGVGRKNVSDVLNLFFQKNKFFVNKAYVNSIKKDENNLDEIIESLRISVRPLTKEDIKNRKLPNQTTGVVITKIANNSPVANSIELNSIIIEAQKKKIKSADELRDITKEVLSSNQKTILLAIYNNQNQRRYIGVKLD